DDGGGIDPERVKKVAIDRGVISVKEAMTMTDDQAVQLIFRPGFSTATQVTDISGRGVGLDAVAKSLKELGGGVEAKIGARGGTLFVINLAANKEWTMQPVCESLKDFVTNMQSDVGRSLQPGAKMNLLGAEKPEFQKGVLLADPLRLSVAITTLVADFAGPHEFDMVMGTERDRVTILVKVKSKSSTKDSPLDLSLPIPICEDCVRQHGGDIGREGDTLKIAFGHILGRQDLVVGMDADLEEAQKKAAKQAVEYLKVLQSELNLNLRVDTAKFQEGLSKWHAVVSTEARKSSFPKLTIGASQERLKADLLLALESAVMSNSSQGN
ncbi:MAG: hypothetical protein NDI61_05265, partial [Bdellovibrionaceae bacterium]|nr:hypothetical protein [Pseudobdellovibrionaceae bacterium]